VGGATVLDKIGIVVGIKTATAICLGMATF